MKSILAALSIVTAVSSVYAQDAAPATTPATTTQVAPAVPATPPVEWKSNAGLNALINTGNSVNQTLSGNALLSSKWDKNKLEFTANGAYGRAKIVDSTGTAVTKTNTKNWKFQSRYDRYVSNPVSIFGLFHVGQDQPAGFDWRYGFATGLAHELWKTDPNFFKYELGYDFTRELRVAAPDGSIHSARVFLQYKHKFSDWATFGQDVETLFNVKDKEDVRVNTLTSLTAKLTDKIAFQAGYAVKFDNVPVTGKKKTDTTTQLGVVVNFL